VEPVKADCERLGPMFRFFHLENWPAFKAGAINHALEQTDSDAEIIAVIDSDYVLSPDWFKVHGCRILIMKMSVLFNRHNITATVIKAPSKISVTGIRRLF